MLLLCIECLLRNALLLFMPGMFPWLGVGFLLSIGALAYFISFGEHYFCLFFICDSILCISVWLIKQGKLFILLSYFVSKSDSGPSRLQGGACEVSGGLYLFSAFRLGHLSTGGIVEVSQAAVSQCLLLGE